eukprot:6868640-Pyramimonas_sp.AAC.1
MEFGRSLRNTGPAAKGPDGLHGAFVRACAPSLAPAFFPLVFKSATLLSEPVQWKGGDLPHMPKGRGDIYAASAS